MNSAAAMPMTESEVKQLASGVCLPRTFFLSLMRQHGPECDISNTSYTFDAGIILVVNHYSPLVVHFNTNFLKAQVFGYWSTSDRNKENIRINLIPGFKNSVHKTGIQKLAVSSLPPFADSTFTCTFPFTFSADNTLVFVLKRIPCFLSTFWNCLLFRKGIE